MLGRGVTVAVQRVDQSNNIDSTVDELRFPAGNGFAVVPYTTLSHYVTGVSFEGNRWNHPSFRMTWPEIGGRCRRVLTRSGMRRRFVVPGYRHGRREIHCESTEERDVALILDSMANLAFQEQPALIDFLWRGERHIHYPDFAIWLPQGLYFVECKRDDEGQSLGIRARTEHLTDILGEAGIVYRLLTRGELDRTFHVQNAKTLRAARNASLSPSDDRKMRIVISKGPCAINYLVAAINPTRNRSIEVVQGIYSAIYAGALSLDWNVPLDRNSLVDRGDTEARFPWPLHHYAKTS